MDIEIRADGAHISGYVNVTEKKSRPVITPHGKVVEEIEPRAFEMALSRAGDISVTVDHDKTHIYASTKDGSLKMYEDGIDLRHLAAPLSFLPPLCFIRHRRRKAPSPKLDSNMSTR